MRKTRKPLIALLAIALAGTLCVGGVVAWLSDTTEEVENTFTVGDINIDLTETWNTDSDGDKKNDSWSAQMVPGATHAKDPLITVKAGSEDCWVFLEVTESSTLDKYIAYAIDEHNWTQLEQETEDAVTKSKTSVYYCYSRDVKSDRSIKVLTAGSHTFKNGADDIVFTWEPNQVLVLPEVTKEMMDDLNNDKVVQPTLAFKAYAVQMAKSNDVDFTVEEAWTIAKQQDQQP